MILIGSSLSEANHLIKLTGILKGPVIVNHFFIIWFVGTPVKE